MVHGLKKMTTAVEVYINDMEGKYYSTKQSWLWLLASFCILVLLVYVLVVQPLFVKLDREAKRTRALLLMIPEDVVDNQPAIQRFMVREYEHSLKTRS
jgi:hypothetical protein